MNYLFHPMKEAALELRLATLQSQSVYVELDNRIRDLEAEVKRLKLLLLNGE